MLTGASGYLGGRLLDHFNRQMPAWKVICGLPQNLNDIQLDAIVHAAGLDAVNCARDPSLANEVNFRLTSQLLQNAAINKIRQFVFLSTVHVYGAPLTGVLDEKMAVPLPLHPYAATKLAAENEVLFYTKEKLLNGAVLRLTNAFGAPMSPSIKRWELIVNDLCRMAVTDGRLHLRSSGRQLRDFVTITDVCRGVEHVLENDLVGLFNLGGELVLTVREMAELVAEIAESVLGFRPEIIVNDDVQEKDWPTFAVPIDRLKATGFSLLKNVQVEIKQTLLFCRENFALNQPI